MKLLMLYFGGNTIPHAIYYCDDFEEDGDFLNISVENEMITTREWDYYNWYHIYLYQEEQVVNAIKELITKIEEI
jgi:hypothetical protein